MITINPPQVVPYAPAAAPIATVKIIQSYGHAGDGQFHLDFQLFSAKGEKIVPLRSALPNGGVPTAAHKELFDSHAGGSDKQSIALQKASLPILKAIYGLNGTVVPDPALPGRGVSSKK